MIRPAQDVINPHIMVVHHNCQHIGGHAVTAQDDEIIQLFVIDLDIALHLVMHDGAAR